MSNTLKIYFAPFQSITTHTFRRVYARHFPFIDKFYTPFFAQIDHDKRLSERKQRELKHLPSGLPEVVPQILSKDPKELIRFANICHDLGYKELSWNLGCPYAQVADKKRGSGLLPYPDLVREILDEVIPEISLRFSIKCRLGYERSDEILQLIPVFNDYPIFELTVHGRIGRQLYSGDADQQALALIVSQFKMPFVHNGDIRNVNDFFKVSSMLSSINTWMIGRGLLINPFLAEEIKALFHDSKQGSEHESINQPIHESVRDNEISTLDIIQLNEDKRNRLRNFLDDLYFGYRQDMNDRLTILNLLKEYWDYLQYLFPNPQQIKRSIKKCRTFDEYEEAVKALF